jgi:hypothetical protein
MHLDGFVASLQGINHSSSVESFNHGQHGIRNHGDTTANVAANKAVLQAIRVPHPSQSRSAWGSAVSRIVVIVIHRDVDISPHAIAGASYPRHL